MRFRGTEGDYRSCGAVLFYQSVCVGCVSSIVDTSSSVCDTLRCERWDDGGDGFITDVASDSDDDLVDQDAGGGREGGRIQKQ